MGCDLASARRKDQNHSVVRVGTCTGPAKTRSEEAQQDKVREHVRPAALVHNIWFQGPVTFTQARSRCISEGKVCGVQGLHEKNYVRRWPAARVSVLNLPQHGERNGLSNVRGEAQ